MRRLVCSVLLLAGCGGEPAASAPPPTEPAASEAPAVPDGVEEETGPIPPGRPKPPPLPGAMPPAPTESTSPSLVLDRYFDALRAGDSAAAAKFALVPEDDAGGADVEGRLEDLAGHVSSGGLAVRVIEIHMRGTWALAVVKVTNTQTARVRHTIESRFLRRQGGEWRVVTGSTAKVDDADHGKLLEWFEGARGGFETEHLKQR